MKMKKSLLICTMLLVAVSSSAQQGLEMDLWPSGPKTSNGDPNDLAKVTVFLPSKSVATGRAVVICPGGGYQHLSFEKEGTSWAPFFNAQGVAVIVLKYRMPHGVWQVPLEDAEEAMRLVRRMSATWDINPRQVGIMGFSAGGHLASTVATHSKGDAAADFQILFYPVITMEQGTTHKGSRENLLGKKPKRKLLNQFCNEQHVTASTPVPLSSLPMTTRRCHPSTASFITRNSARARCLPPCISIPQAVMASAVCSRSPIIMR